MGTEAPLVTLAGIPLNILDGQSVGWAFTTGVKPFQVEWFTRLCRNAYGNYIVIDC